MTRKNYYNSYTDDFKATIVAQSAIAGILAKHVAESLDIHGVMLYR